MAVRLRTIEPSIADGFGQMRGIDTLCARQIGDAARHAQDALVYARRESQAVDRAFQQGLFRGSEPAVALHLAGTEVGIHLAGA